MGEPAYRLLDKGLPRNPIGFNPAFAARQKQRRQAARIAAEQRAYEATLAPAVLELIKKEITELVEDARRQAAAIMASAQEFAKNAIAEARKQIGADALIDDRGPEEKKIPAIDIIKAVAEKHGVRVSDIKGASRSSFMVTARHEAIVRVYVARPDLSTPALGRIFGGRDHTSILHAVRKAGVCRGNRVYAAQRRLG